MKKAVATLLVNGLSLWVIDYLFDGIIIASPSSLLMLTIILVILNSTIKPILQIFAFPFTILTFGIFSFVVNALVLGLGFSLVDGAMSVSFTETFFACIVLGIINSLLSELFDLKK